MEISFSKRSFLRVTTTDWAITLIQLQTNTLTASAATSAESKAFADSFSAAIAQHRSAGVEAATIAAVTATTSANAAASAPSDSSHNHEQLQRIAEQHQQDVEQQEKQDQHNIDNNPEKSTLSQDEQHQQVLQHIATAAAEAGSTLATVPITSVPAPPPPTKPVAGSEEWHKLRRDNHKEVERRRRETINEGINDLAKVVPNCDKNKGSILRQAVKYIQEILVQNERLAGDAELLAAAKIEIDKYIVEKSVAEATYQTLNTHHEQLKRDYEELRKKMGELEPHVTKKQRVE
ncbi:basic helix-loop-helix protein [Haplosporangium sp. Z 27]|nr:basic helix-loop-helix protein [Haplosporangium sp. Z 27]